MTRTPKGYRGIRHETIGSDILSVLNVVLAPEHVLGPELMGRLREVKPDGWYPIALLLEVLDRLAEKVGPYVLRQMGRQLFAASHAEMVKKTAQSAADIIFGIDGMYHHANRGMGIGGWEVVSFKAGEALLSKTTPHHCALEEGIFSEALASVGVTCELAQLECFRSGADACLFQIRSRINDERWSGGRSYTA